MLKTVEGVYHGGKVDLAEVPEGADGARVLVTFVSNGTRREDFAEAEVEDNEPERDWRWYRDNAAAIAARIREQAAKTGPLPPGITPSGLPERMPTDEEWQERGARIVQMLRQWEQEEPSEDLATWEELKAGLEANPIRFREFRVDE